MSVLRIRSNRRYAVRSAAKLTAAGLDAAGCLLIELSQDGARVSCLGSHILNVGDEVTLATDHAQPIRATVRWSDAGRAGLRLTRPLHVGELSDFVEAARRQTAIDAQVA